MSDSRFASGSPSLVSCRLLPPDDKAASDFDDTVGRVAAPCGFDFIGRLASVFTDAGEAGSPVASIGAQPAGKRIGDRAAVLLSKRGSPPASPDGDRSAPQPEPTDAAQVETAARLAARLQNRVTMMQKTINLLSDADDMAFDDNEVVLKKKKNIRFAQANYVSICERLENTVGALRPTDTADQIQQTLVATEKAMLQDIGEFHSHAATASNPASTAQSLVHVVVNKTVGVLPESVHESMKDAAVWIADQARGSPVAKVAFKIVAALGMFLAYAVPIALIVASVIFPPIAPITATLAGGATIACPFVACFCGELWKALRDKDTGPDTADVVLRLQQH